MAGAPKSGDTAASSAVFVVGERRRVGGGDGLRGVRGGMRGGEQGQRAYQNASATKEGAGARSLERIGVGRLAARPVAALALLNKDAVSFIAGGLAGGIGKTMTAPLDRVKLLLQTSNSGMKGKVASAAASGNLFKALAAIGKEEGVKGYWKGNMPQVLRVLPYAALQLWTYDVYKGILQDKDGNLSVPMRMTSGALAGMTSTLITYPLDTIRLRMAVDPAMVSMTHVVRTVVKEEGAKAMFKGVGGALMGIAPYMALELATYDVLKKNVPEDMKGPASNFVTGFMAAMCATSVCFPLDTVRRQMQLKAAVPTSLHKAIYNAVQKDGVASLYRGFVPNMLKNLPNKGIRLSTFDACKTLISTAERAYDEEVEAKELEDFSKNKGTLVYR